MNVLGGAVEAYEKIIRDPSLDALQAASTDSNGLRLEVFSKDTQSFLGEQLAALEKIRQGPEPSGIDSNRSPRGRGSSLDGEDSLRDQARVNEHIGPVQFNMGGIQVDADDMLQRLRVRASHSLLVIQVIITNKSVRIAKATRPRNLKPPIPLPRMEGKYRTRHSLLSLQTLSTVAVVRPVVLNPLVAKAMCPIWGTNRHINI